MRRLYGRLISNLGWTHEEIDRRSIREVEDLLSYWNESPPLREVVNAYMGVRPPEPEPVPGPPQELTQEQFDRMVAGLRAEADRMNGKR